MSDDRRVWITGIGLVTAAGIGLDAFREALRRARSPIRAVDRFDASAFRSRVAAQVDDFDPAARSGWSVLVVGTAEEIVHPHELEAARDLGLEPWAGEVRDRFVRIRPTRVSGRRVSPS